MPDSIITQARANFHASLVSESGPLCLLSENGKLCMASNADRSQATSREISLAIAEELGAVGRKQKPSGQTMGSKFESAVHSFLAECLPHLDVIRPGPWKFLNVGGSRRSDQLAAYFPYRHLGDLAHEISNHPELLSVLGNLYAVSPDVLVVREALSDSAINEFETVVDGHSALLTPLRAANNTSESLPTPAFIHAVISCKWTMRSDRSQNTRAEALNLIRNRKGRTPHIVAVTAEPSLSRIASIALGTGDIDMTYHFALPELERAVEIVGNDESQTLLKTLVEGDRLRDISDLPLDLAV